MHWMQPNAEICYTAYVPDIKHQDLSEVEGQLKGAIKYCPVTPYSRIQ